MKKIRSRKDLPDWVGKYPGVGEQIRMLRKALGMSQEELAGLVGMRQESVGRIESGGVAPNMSTLEKIAGAFGADLDVLIVPKKSVDEMLAEKALEKARVFVDSVVGSFAVDGWKVDDVAYEKELWKTKKLFMTRKKGLLWE